ncbi:class I SAM-dependent RNA methyltransferase [Caenispirillum salinarum]|uniref:class I SAM-dependent RNA methyltransferase n=1 Tax=Caenispirillum salinarum TaxID=859058 RepID=UPI0005BA0E9F|nr:class I SAM-dependent RNA methyltransferase [Caenispirillum salinarum]
MAQKKPYRGRRGQKRAAPGAPVSVVVDTIGARGDGIATRSDTGERLYIPGVLPGEHVTVRPGEPRGDGRSARLEAVDAAAPERVEPPCPHFGRCGGCALQHMAPEALALWKRDLVVQALGRRGFDAEQTSGVAATLSLPAGTRRRATFAIKGQGGGAVLGFNARASHAVVPIETCLLPSDALRALVAPLRDLIRTVPLPRKGGDCAVTLTDTGADVVLDLGAEPDLETRERLAAFAAAHDLARLSLRIDGGPPEPAAARRLPEVRLGGRLVALPAGGFLQPSREGEAALVDHVLRAVEAAPPGPVADLFGGIGTFALPLHGAGRVVHLAEGAAEAVGAVSALGLDGLTAEHRDLFERPLGAKGLKRFAAVVFDPPRAGAQAQAAELAAHGPGVVVAVSCNPATFARDARLLVDGGYTMESVVPVDQFPWAAHVEVVAVFRR